MPEFHFNGFVLDLATRRLPAAPALKRAVLGGWRLRAQGGVFSPRNWMIWRIRGAVRTHRNGAA